jgi:galactose-1-phosphate uridylyltransferase
MLAVDKYEPDNPTQDWRLKLSNIKNGYGVINANDSNTKNNYFKRHDIGIFNPHNGSHVKVQENGTIDIFASPTLGIRLDPNTETMSILAKKTNINTQNFDLQTNPIYFRFNSQPVDIDQLNVRPPVRGEIYSEEFKKLLKELGIRE